MNRTLSILRSLITSQVQSHSAQAGIILFTTKFGTPNEIRTRVTCVKGGCPGPLDDGSISFGYDARTRTATKGFGDPGATITPHRTWWAHLELN